MPTSPRSRAWWLIACRLAALASACMLALSAWVLVAGGRSPASAATNAGALTIGPTSGNSDTEIDLAFTSGAGACAGDSANQNYKVQSFVVPAATDLDALTFDAQGPVGGGTPFYFPDTNPFVNQQTDITTGNISLLPGTFTLSVLSPGALPAGDYVAGVACTLGTGAGMTKSYWTAPITVAEDPAGGAAQFSFVVGAAAPTTTTTTDGAGTTTTTEGSGTTTTTDGSGTTTTTDGSTTTTTDGTTSPTDGTGGGGVSSGGIYSGGTPSSASPVSTVGQLPYTGSSPLPLVLWAVALIVFGRMAMLLGKKTKVVGDDHAG